MLQYFSSQPRPCLGQGVRFQLLASLGWWQQSKWGSLTQATQSHATALYVTAFKHAGVHASVHTLRGPASSRADGEGASPSISCLWFLLCGRSLKASVPSAWSLSYSHGRSEGVTLFIRCMYQPSEGPPVLSRPSISRPSRSLCFVSTSCTQHYTTRHALRITNGADCTAREPKNSTRPVKRRRRTSDVPSQQHQRQCRIVMQHRMQCHATAGHLSKCLAVPSPGS